MTKKPKFLKEPTDRGYQFQKDITIINHICNIVTIFIKYIAYTLMVFFLFYYGIKELAGKETDARIFFSLLIDIGKKNWLPYSLAAIGFGYGLLQRNLRRKTIKRLSARVSLLEIKHNPSKQSSEINPDGTTRIGDKQWLT